MTTAGPFNFGGTSTVAGTGSRDWTNSGNILASDDSKATVSNMDDTEITYELRALAPQGAGAIADGDTVTEVQITAEVNSAQNTATRYTLDYMAKLVVGGSVTGSDQKSATKWPTTDTQRTFTFSGLSLTGAQFKASDFGFAYQAQVTNDGALFNIRVDQIFIAQVTYTVASTSADQIVNPVQTTINAGIAAHQSAHAGCGAVGY